MGLLFIMVYHVSSLLLFLHHDISLIQTFFVLSFVRESSEDLARATLSRNTRARVAFKATATCVWYTRSLSGAVDGAGGLTEHTTMLHVMYMCCPFSLKVRRKHFIYTGDTKTALFFSSLRGQALESSYSVPTVPL